MRTLLFLFAFFLFNGVYAQFTFGVDRANGAGPTATNITGPDAGCITSSLGLTRGAGVVSNSGGDFNTRNWTSNSAVDAKANDEYLEFSLTTGDAANITSLNIRIDRSGTGPNNYLLEYSFDAFSTAGTEALSANNVTSTSPITYTATTNPSNFTGTVTYRLFAWGASSINGTLDIEELGGVPVANDGVRIEGNKMVTAPVSLFGFEVAMLNGAAELKWSTTSESGNDYFAIERSIDGRKFDEIGRVAGIGNSQTEQNYQFLDTRLATGFTYYRLRQVDFDATETIYGPISLENTTIGPKPSIFPNPVGDIVRIKDLDNKVRSITIYDAQGREVLFTDESSIKAKAGINVTSLKTGLYFVRFVQNGELQQLSFLKK